MNRSTSLFLRRSLAPLLAPFLVFSPSILAQTAQNTAQPTALANAAAAVNPAVAQTAPAPVLAKVSGEPAMHVHARTPLMSGAALAAGMGDHPADFSNVAPTGQSITLTVGRAQFINTKHRLTRVFVTNPNVLDSYTASPNQIVLTAKAPGTSNLILWDETGQSQAYFVSSDMNIDTLRESLKQALPTESIEVRQSDGRIILSGTVGTDAMADAAVKLASMYAKDVSNSMVVNPSQVKQVKLKVRIVEVDRSKLTTFGVNFFNSGGNKTISTTTSQFPSLTTSSSGTGSSAPSISISDPLNFLLYSSHLNIGATIQDLETMQVLQILAEPTITALSGQKANFLAGGEFPFPVVQGGTSGSTAISIQFRPYGVKVEFTPYVNLDGTIDLKVAPEVSSLDYSNSVTVSGVTVPALSTRRADTRVVLNNGQSFAISGLLNNQTTDQLAHTPGIASVPILGQLFKSKSINHSRTELIVIVTPTIVDPMTETLVPAEPQRAVPLVDPAVFDSQLPKPKKKK
jgi:pilus assembly protein CpaC